MLPKEPCNNRGPADSHSRCHCLLAAVAEEGTPRWACVRTPASSPGDRDWQPPFLPLGLAVPGLPHSDSTFPRGWRPACPGPSDLVLPGGGGGGLDGAAAHSGGIRGWFEGSWRWLGNGWEQLLLVANDRDREGVAGSQARPIEEGGRVFPQGAQWCAIWFAGLQEQLGARWVVGYFFSGGGVELSRAIF